MRHEDHVGHKVVYANGEADTTDDRFSNATTGGIALPLPTNSDPKWTKSGINCYFFHKVHQGVHSPDAFGNSLHELVMHARCTSTRSDYANNTSAIMSGLIRFGNAGEFTRFCGEDRNQIINIGKDSNNINFPNGDPESMRNIVDRSCVTSGEALDYELWSGDLKFRTGSATVSTNEQPFAVMGGGWDVLDSIRYYDPAAPNRIRYVIDRCKEQESLPFHGICDYVRQNYPANIAWNDTRSPFQGRHRGAYVGVPEFDNTGGPTVWYTDVFGGRLSRTPFTGSVKQHLSATRSMRQITLDSRDILLYFDSWEDTVHAPN